MGCYRCHPKHVILICGAFVLITVWSVLYIEKTSPLSLPRWVGNGEKFDRLLVVQAGGHVSELKGDPIQWLGGDNSVEIPVVVVEEHHEVLHHWFSAVDKGIVSRTGNLLIHIDGHSDAAPPIFYDGYPESFYPKNVEELRVMVQRNDAFIVEAAMGGVISHMIWVWPEWDQINHDTPHQVTEMLLGVADIFYKELDNTHFKTCCLCEADEHHIPQSCTFLNMTADNQKDGADLNPKLCEIKTSIIFEDIREDLALKMARNGSLFSEINGKKLLLDIDEDFYGCESAIQPVLDEKVTMKQVHLINLYINKMFRPLTSVMESAIDKFMADIITALVQFKDCREDSATCQQSLDIHMTKVEEDIKNASILKGGFRFRKGSKKLPFWTSLVKKLKEFTSGQLRKLKELGFCFQTTPKAFDFDQNDDEHFRLCHGANVPGSSVVIYHTPTVAETQKRTKLLVELLESTKKFAEPSLVTVCRSMRDGYTPRNFFKQIERDVLSSVHDVFKTDNIYYDIDLLGGKSGWPDRHIN